MTDDVDDDVMLQIVTDPDDYYPVTDFDRLNEIVSSITTQACSAPPTEPPPVDGKCKHTNNTVLYSLIYSISQTIIIFLFIVYFHYR